MSKRLGLGLPSATSPLRLLFTPPDKSRLARLGSPPNHVANFLEGLQVPASQIILPQTAMWLRYTFNVYCHDGDWNAVGGIYVFAGARIVPAGTRQWHPLYIGKSQDFAKYLPTHRKWLEAVRLGATHVHAMVIWGEEARRSIEQELIRAYRPPLNVVGK